VHGGQLHGVLLSDEKLSLQGSRKCAALARRIQVFRKEYTQDLFKSSKEERIFTSIRWHGLHHPGRPASVPEPLVLKLVSTPARGNESSWEAVESRTARQSETDEEEGRVSQG